MVVLASFITGRGTWWRLGAALVLLCRGLSGQQVADTTHRPLVAPSWYREAAGPVVALDEAHNNFHTIPGRYAPFAGVLRRDGFRVHSLRQPITAATLSGVDVLVISNPLHDRNIGHWVLPTPSAFTPGEIAAVESFVRRGGSLLLIADHMPFAGAAARLGEALGVAWTNGFASDSTRGEPLPFARLDGSLADHAVARGRSPAEQVDSIATFTGSAFRMTGGGTSLMNLGPASVSLDPRVAWVFDSTTTRVAVGGWSQGALLRIGRGRVAAFGEAAMFSAQWSGTARAAMGFNHPRAHRNAQFLLNVMHWLSGGLE